MDSSRSPRGFAAPAVLLLAVVAAAVLLLPGCPPSGSSGPDIVVIVWDTCRGDRVDVNGYALPTTPRLAQLAAKGVNFRRCFAPSPWTPPSHASLFTGLLPSRHGLREELGARVHPGIPLLATTLKEAGYETVAVPSNPLLGVAGLLDGFETVLPVTPGAEKDSGDVIAARIDSWARAREKARRDGTGDRRPLFLFVNLMDSHLPLDPAREDLVAVHGAEAAATVPADVKTVSTMVALDHLLGLGHMTDEGIRLLSLAYDGGVRGDDRATGRILDLLRDRGLREDALVAVTGDHGECLGEHGELEHRMTIREPVLHVPLVIRWPGRFEGGRTEDAQVRMQDLYATILEAAGVAVPAVTGKDSLSLLGSPVAPRDGVSELLSTASNLPARLRSRFNDLPAHAVQRLRNTSLVFREAATGPSPRKFVIATSADPSGKGTVVKEELFDLRSDPGEDRDLLGPASDPAMAAEAARLRKKALEAIR